MSEQTTIQIGERVAVTIMATRDWLGFGTVTKVTDDNDISVRLDVDGKVRHVGIKDLERPNATPANEGAASLKDFDKPLHKPIGQVNMQLENERDAEIERLKADRDAAIADRDFATKALAAMVYVYHEPKTLDEAIAKIENMRDRAESGLIQSNYYIRAIRNEDQ